MMEICSICKKEKEISRSLGICIDCIRDRFEKSLPYIKKAHKKEIYSEDGVTCGICIRRCRIPEGEKGYCEARKNTGGKIIPKTGSDEYAFVECYYDLLPTNCVAADFCGEKESKRGKNLAVFYGFCNFDCLFCQNWNYKNVERKMSVDDLLFFVDDETKCICFFGGDPTPQIFHALKAAERSERARICWETNGSFSCGLAKKVGDVSYRTGGTIKFDIKAFSNSIYMALCGVKKENTFKNFKFIYKNFRREDPPILVASTPLFPGYVDVFEGEKISEFIASIDPNIPYALLAFHPDHKMMDLPNTSKDLATSCFNAAKEHLERVKIGNVWLLK